MRLEGRLRRGGRGLLGRGVSDVFAHDLVGVAGGAEGSTATGDSTIVSCAGVATAAGPGFALGLPSALDGSHHAARRNTAIRSEDHRARGLEVHERGFDEPEQDLTDQDAACDRGGEQRDEDLLVVAVEAAR